MNLLLDFHPIPEASLYDKNSGDSSFTKIVRGASEFERLFKRDRNNNNDWIFKEDV
jgi:hypothetical protein